jgi:5-methylcytosine-specific restriction endonuclease McrA
LASRSSHTPTWVERVRRWCAVGAISLELVKFDTQLLQNAEIRGVEYQQGQLMGDEIREYLLEKWGRQCAYCNATNVPLQIEHIVPKVRDGSQRVSTLTIACQPCHDAKGTRTAAEFGHPHIQAQARQPLRDAAEVTATRWALSRRLVATGLPLKTGAGGRTKWHRTTRELPKTHWLDAVCVGASTPERLAVRGIVPLLITAMGRHRRQMGRPNAAGFPGQEGESDQRGWRVAYRRSRAGGGSRLPRESWDPCGSAGDPGDGVVQCQDAPSHHRGHPCAVVPAAPAWGRVHVCDGRGASSPGLTVGVSAPQMRMRARATSAFANRSSIMPLHAGGRLHGAVSTSEPK